MTRLDIGPSHLLCILICDLKLLRYKTWPRLPRMAKKCGHPELGWAICLRKVAVCLSWDKPCKGAVAH